MKTSARFVLGLFLSSILFSFASAEGETFSDVSSEHENFVAIEYLVMLGTLEGYDDGSFRPDNTVNRAELMKMLVSGQGVEPVEGEFTPECFPDVPAGEWYEPYVCYAFDEGWVGGYPDGTFQPGNTVQRVEAVKMIVNGLGFNQYLEDDWGTEWLFDDTGEEEWYAPYVALMNQFNVLEVSEGNYEPGEGMSRALTAEYIFRTFIAVLTGEAFDEAVYDTYNQDADFEVEEGEYVIMDAGNYFYSVETINVDAGELVIIEFETVNGTHDFVIDELGVSEVITSGTVVSFHAPEEAGEYAYYCSVGSHRANGMEGVLVVE